jgi:lysophospholipase L1-like esterase
MKNYRVEMDSFGFLRSVSNITNAEMNIVFLGGSTTECRYVDDSLRFPSLVGEKMRARGCSVNTFNAGVERSHSGHSLNVLMHKIVHRDFDVAVLMHGINDLVHLSYNGSYFSDEKTPNRPGLVTLARPDFDEPDLYFFRKHGVGMRAEKAFQVLFPRLQYDLLAAKVKTVTDQSPLEFGWEKMRPVGEPQFAAFRKNLRSFVALCRAHGIQPVLMTQFNRMTEDEFDTNPIYLPYKKRLEESLTSVGAFCESYRKMNEIVREVAKEAGVVLIDLDEEIPKSADLMYDMVHLRAAGSRRVAEVVSEVCFFERTSTNF